MTMQSSILIGLVATLCHSAHGLVFRDNIKQVVKGNSLTLLHGVEDATSVRFGNASDTASQGWKFDTGGLPDDQAAVTPLDSSDYLTCFVGTKCTLSPHGSPQAYRISRVDEEKPIFTLQDLATSLYVSRTVDLYLELSGVQDDSIKFTFEKV
ncbi:hypothetical protein BDV25DRAFT_138608 [Aspergillus avenaceus]|uniref:Immunoglobulin V-set domain-containing protein n=1 Tax=Aspergillus avenaceus TaxID=36643 RepID=A0A5N6TZD9_ASPAV|nr:hypothetical protein BDV25DRAFT_138608 [Aspergillus avenaceus]